MPPEFCRFANGIAFLRERLSLVPPLASQKNFPADIEKRGDRIHPFRFFHEEPPVIFFLFEPRVGCVNFIEEVSPIGSRTGPKRGSSLLAGLFFSPLKEIMGNLTQRELTTFRECVNVLFSEAVLEN